ncbi:DUF3618 domain-containing protein [Corynebacterium glyciniphilum]|uniref:DUF3618 domain-containing protein n=1 Tax=Corynebacterium glyciniphilum TaxID=1404244 RepID=UPI002651716C|nr:DUF3618 domain-containing protein [Corynebacterium glyciniphilum]MDN5684724.1 DUF3618 domain-containing protein [Corynebacterium glyciniphilum]MDN6704530.1 DUF3618 domain-containing protein [Corynebacterium glyciniphilum]
MARTIDSIQSDIERTREQLAKTLDELSVRAAPKNLADETKTQVSNVLAQPKVQMIIGGVVAGVGLVVALTVAGKRNEKKQIKEIQRLLADARS